MCSDIKIGFGVFFYGNDNLLGDLWLVGFLYSYVFI